MKNHEWLASIYETNTGFTAFRMTTSHEATLKTFQKWLKDDIKSITDNFLEIVKLAKVEPDTTSPNTTPSRAQEHYEVIVRASNMIRAQESLLKLIYQIQQFYIINDFKLINDSIAKGNTSSKVDEIDMKLINLRNELSTELINLEEEYYHSLIKWFQDSNSRWFTFNYF